VVETSTYEIVNIELNCEFLWPGKHFAISGKTGWPILCGEVEIRSANEKCDRTGAADG